MKYGELIQFSLITSVVKLIGSDKPLNEIFFAQIERYLHTIGVSFEFDPNSKSSWKEQIQTMVAEFESKFLDKHLLIVIDEMLEYLKGTDPIILNKNLMLLRQVGEICDGSQFKILFGVQ